MQLAYLLPHLDAEINRLQKARDLLAFIPASFDFSTVSRVGPSPLSEQPLRELGEDYAVPVAEQPTNEPTSVSKVADALPAPTPPIVRVRARRNAVRALEVRQDRRRRVVVLDTALRGAVPAGPVVVSAEDVRRTQAAKTAEATRAAEAKKSCVNSLSSFGWKAETNNGLGMNTLLQRLIHLGEGLGDEEKLTEFPAIGQRANLQAPLASKLH